MEQSMGYPVDNLPGAEVHQDTADDSGAKGKRAARPPPAFEWALVDTRHGAMGNTRAGPPAKLAQLLRSMDRGLATVNLGPPALYAPSQRNLYIPLSASAGGEYGSATEECECSICIRALAKRFEATVPFSAPGDDVRRPFNHDFNLEMYHVNDM
ncbi:hypothetical protein OH76DRAFT_1406510 [Lentinus brumalis]|uniref:Uncharacterized protein n=1 Tax=Lentinus brumalis TaxID=2498619 RepID=A0A371D304_9APHY|nr:hypothetical protein OH76DRAFT_1406510 [Polyporus brumalis]